MLRKESLFQRRMLNRYGPGQADWKDPLERKHKNIDVRKRHRMVGFLLQKI